MSSKLRKTSVCTPLPDRCTLRKYCCSAECTSPPALNSRFPKRHHAAKLSALVQHISSLLRPRCPAAFCITRSGGSGRYRYRLLTILPWRPLLISSRLSLRISPLCRWMTRSSCS
ncbi:hypothetical protein EYF80_018171 [Liparis tanakae]|uniref:Uncharacterized protein n=1 Tax=Liparis tanakae TaxID=230148 RepID=A0A4Z2I0S4_9TELE|nr:hypothetical protein EYF80_018171 [Liparis tanakae]